MPCPRTQASQSSYDLAKWEEKRKKELETLRRLARCVCLARAVVDDRRLNQPSQIKVYREQHSP
eukprot:scaffold24086_cov26-Tisochrysis_lutea.AAC.3